MTSVADPKLEIARLTAIRDRLLAIKNCGTGAGGFAAGNTCGRSGGAARSPEQKEHARKKFHKKLRKAFPFLKDKDIGDLTEARGDRESSVSLPRNQITAHEHDLIYGTMGEPGNGIRKPREIHSVESESKKWRLSATVSTNSMHGVMAGEKKYKVEYSAEGPNHQGHDYVDHFNSRTKAIAAAEKGHAELAKEFTPRLSPKTGTTVKELFRKAETTPARMEKLIYKQETPWRDVPHDQRVAWLANERAKIKNASKSAGKGEIRKGPHDAPIAWFDVDTRIAGGKVRWSEWTAADERATTGAAKGLLAVVGKAASEDEPSGVPDAQSILDSVLDEMGHAEAWANETLDRDVRIDILDAVSVAGQAWLRREAESLLESVSTKALFGETRARVGNFFRRAGKYIRELFTAGVLAVTGPGPANPQEAIIQATQQQVQEQLDYLDKFKHQILSESKPLTQEFAARAEMYGSAAYAGSLEIERQGVIAADMASEVIRILDKNEHHCLECPPLAELGWVKMKDAEKLGVVPLGKTKCRIRCRCRLSYR